MAPHAVLAGVGTVRDATTHERAGPFFRHLLFEELLPGSEVPSVTATPYAHAVWERFSNPWLNHAWSTIVANQSDKMRIRVVPSIVAFAAQTGHAPPALALGLAAHLRLLHMEPAALNDETLWGARLTAVPGLADATSRWLDVLSQQGALAAMQSCVDLSPR